MTRAQAMAALAAPAFGLLLAGTSPALAQGFAVEGLGGYAGLSATKSADAVFGSSGGGSFGGSLSYAFSGGFYVEGGARSFSKTGQRVFVADPSGPVFPLGFPLSMRLVPIFLNIGFRFQNRSPVVPYLGVGGSITSFHEESTVAGLTYTQDETKAGGQVVGGVEVGKGHLRFAAEGGYAFVPNSVGIGGVSKVYGEKDLGGFTVVGKLIFNFASRD